MNKAFWDEMIQKDKELYRKSFRTLLNTTNIVRDKDENHRAMYNFLSNRENPYGKYMQEEFEYAGFEMIINTDFKYIHLRDLEETGAKINRQKLGLIESVSLCCLWLIYLEKINANTLKKNITIELQEFLIKLNVFNITTPQFKTSFDKTFELFKRFNLIDYKGKPSEEGFYMTLFPTLQFAIDQSELKNFVNSKMEEYISTKEKENEVVEEEDFEDE